MVLNRLTSAAILISVYSCSTGVALAQLKPSPTLSKVVSTDRFQLSIEGDRFFLSSISPQGRRRVSVPREWLIPPAAEEREKDDDFVVSSFVYNHHVNSFPVGNGEIGLQFSSYDIQPKGTMHAAIGRDVFLLFEPANGSLRPGLIDLDVTKERHFGDGCFSALMHHFVIADANGDGLTDIGVVKEEIRCPGEDDDWVGPLYVQHSLHWYLLTAGGWKRDPEDSSWPEHFVELPLIGLSSGPVDFAAKLNWHSYDPAKWQMSPFFKPVYRRKLMAGEAGLKSPGANRPRMSLPRPEQPLTSSPEE